MRIEIDFPHGSFDAEYSFFDAAGQPVPAPAKVVIRPSFYPKDPLSRVLNMLVVNDRGQRIQRAVLTALSRTGRVRVHDRTSSVTPPCDDGDRPDVKSTQQPPSGSKPK